MELSFAIVALLALLAVYVWQHFVTFFKFIRSASKLPTNRPIPILGHAFFFLGDRSGLMKRIDDVVEQNAPMFMIWMGPFPVLMLTKPQHMEIILGSAKHIHKNFPYNFFSRWAGYGIFASSGKIHQIHRKLITPAFHFSILEKFVEVFAEKSEKLIKNLQKEIGSKKWDIVPYLRSTTLEIILETAMGVQLDTEAVKEDAEYVEASHKFTGRMTERIVSPWLYPEIIYSLTPSGRHMKKSSQTMVDFTDKVIKERKQQLKLGGTRDSTSESDIGRKTRNTNFLDLLLVTSQNSGLLTDEDIRHEVSTFIFAGHDTTTYAIAWCLQLLAVYPEVQEKIYEELESIFHDSSRSPTTKDFYEMKYLERVIKETLRLYPIAPFVARTVQEDVEIDGCTVPAGMNIILSIFAMHHDPELYPDPHKFNPDNFLLERAAGRHSYAYIPFSAGPRNCIGQKFAMLEMKTILSSILRHYKIEADGEIPTPLYEIILKPQNGVQVKITPRAIFT